MNAASLGKDYRKAGTYATIDCQSPPHPDTAKNIVYPTITEPNRVYCNVHGVWDLNKTHAWDQRIHCTFKYDSILLILLYLSRMVVR